MLQIQISPEDMFLQRPPNKASQSELNIIHPHCFLLINRHGGANHKEVRMHIGHSDCRWFRGSIYEGDCSHQKTRHQALGLLG